MKGRTYRRTIFEQPNFLGCKTKFYYPWYSAKLARELRYRVYQNQKESKAYLRKGVIPLNAGLLKGTAFLLQSKKHYNHRPVKEVTFSKIGDKTRSGRLRHHQEFEFEIKLCNTRRLLVTRQTGEKIVSSFIFTIYA